MARKGTISKKFVFYESDKTTADFRIALLNDGLSQANFMRSIIHAYIRGDKDLMPFIDKMKKKMGPQYAVWQRQSRMKREKAIEKMRDLGWLDDEIMDIFDQIESE